MRIAVCIPTMNEADTIAVVASAVDAGLKALGNVCGFTGQKYIVNVDSGSTDGTSGCFLSCSTEAAKVLIDCRQAAGKGYNLITFFKWMQKNKIDYGATVDGDLRSITPAWLMELLVPILSGVADFVSALYERSPFEGSTTNHFAFPVASVFHGSPIAQPIGGEFAFTMDASSSFLHSARGGENPNALGYGIDILLTMSAIFNGMRIVQVPLGRKIHAPSFHKLEPIFPQVCSSALSLAREDGKFPRTVNSPKGTGPSFFRGEFAHHEAAELMLIKAMHMIERSVVHEWIVDKSLVYRLADDFYLSSFDWASLLADWLKYALKTKQINENVLSAQLLPWFVVRSVGFWKKASEEGERWAEKEIGRQASYFWSHFNLWNGRC